MTHKIQISGSTNGDIGVIGADTPEEFIHTVQSFGVDPDRAVDKLLGTLGLNGPVPQAVQTVQAAMPGSQVVGSYQTPQQPGGYGPPPGQQPPPVQGSCGICRKGLVCSCGQLCSPQPAARGKYRLHECPASNEKGHGVWCNPAS